MPLVGRQFSIEHDNLKLGHELVVSKIALESISINNKNTTLAVVKVSVFTASFESDTNTDWSAEKLHAHAYIILTNVSDNLFTNCLFCLTVT